MYARVGRRVVLGAGGLALALPLLAHGGGPSSGSGGRSAWPTRFLVVFTPNGVIDGAWLPSGGEHDFALGPTLAPLEPYRSEIVVVSGVDVESSYHGPGDASHWNGMGHMLTGTELIELDTGVFTGGGISVDQAIAAHVGGETKLASLELCVESNPATIASRMSYLGPKIAVPPEPDPAKAFVRLFGELSPDDRARRKSVLDAVTMDLASLESRLGALDREKVGAHLTAVREVEKRLFAPLGDGEACTMPPAPSVDALDPASFPEVGRAQMDLLVMALACDLTRVGSLMWSMAGSTTHHTWLGIGEQHHELSHLPKDDLDVQAALAKIDRFYAEQVAYLLAALQSVPEGDGTLLDHTLVLWCNELSDGETHSRRAVPYVLAGRAVGALTTGRFLQYGGAEHGHVHGDLLASLCAAMGMPPGPFGNPAYSTGPLAGLLG